MGRWWKDLDRILIPMAWVLRPSIGDPTMRTRFFRADTWGNAYLTGEKRGAGRRRRQTGHTAVRRGSGSSGTSGRNHAGRP